MKYLLKYQKFNESSQSKKIKNYIGYSVVLQWYRENKNNIAKLLGCDVTDLADEDTLMKQSYDLVNSVVNTQTGGNSGIDGTDIPGFNSFERIENNLIHDILHNIYNVKTKEFNKSLSGIQFTESEIMEEIECLAIEESFMKYMNIKYLKTDFINANINQLASYLMMSIIKNDPERIQKILDKEVEPYLEIYGEKYFVEGTPFENFFDLFSNTSADRRFRIKNSKDFKDYMIWLINVGEGIDVSGGDRANYPGGSYYGTKSWYDLSDREASDFIEQSFSEKNSYSKQNYYLITEDDNDISKFEFDYVIIGKGINIIPDEESEEFNKKKIYDKVNNIKSKLKFDGNIKDTAYSNLEIFPDKIDYDENEIYVNYLNKETNKKYKGYIKIDNIPNYLTSQLKLESFNNDYSIDNYKDRENLEAIPIDSRLIGENNWISDVEWFKYLEELYGDIIYIINDEKYIGIFSEIKDDIEVYTILSEDEFRDHISDKYSEGDGDYFDDDHNFINFALYEIKSIEDITKILFRDNDAVSILRRNFRAGDIIKNNTKLGNISSYRNDTEIKTKNPIHNYIDFSGEYETENSISKKVLTKNGQMLIKLLNNLRGYVIKNFDTIKKNDKLNKQKFKEEDINKFKKLNLDDLNNVKNFDFEHMEFDFNVGYNWGNSLSNILRLKNEYEIQSLVKFYNDFKDITDVDNLIQNDNDIEYLKNFVNIRGSLKTTKDYFEFKKLIKDIQKKNVFLFKDLILQIYNNKNINISVDETKILKLNIKNGKLKEAFNLENFLNNMLKKYYPLVKTKEIKITEIDNYNIEFMIKI